jgi:regulator of nucleoside diphosphate kinase
MQSDEDSLTMEKQIWITQADKQRLQKLIDDMNEVPDKRDLPHIKQLELEVGRAKVIEDSKKVPADVITMRSRVRLRNLTRGTVGEYTLVYPSEANAEEGGISVLAPLGTAMIGYRAGSEFEAKLPAGVATFRVEEILYQPESAGDYDL